VGATNAGVLHIGKREVAVVRGLSDSGVSILANDPRVNSIQVVHTIKKAAVQGAARILAMLAELRDPGCKERASPLAIVFLVRQGQHRQKLAMFHLTTHKKAPRIAAT
jgi:hypothetical protein